MKQQARRAAKGLAFACARENTVAAEITPEKVKIRGETP